MTPLRSLICLFVFAVSVPSSRELVAGEDASIEVGLPIHVREFQGFARVSEPVTFGFPIAEVDEIMSPTELVVLDPAGKPAAAQFRVTQRWRARPDDSSAPIRWLLVDLQVDVDAGETVTYLLRAKAKKDKKPKSPKLSIKQKKKTGTVKVKTGSAVFVVSGEDATGLEVVRADLDGDGKVKGQEHLISKPSRGAFALTDRFGDEHSSRASAVNVEIEEHGKLRTVVRVDGGHDPIEEDAGIGREFFRYRTRYTFYAGKPYVRVQHTVKNSYLDDALGNIGFEGYSFRTELHAGAAKGPLSATFGVEGGLTQTLESGGRLVQDSDGGDKWNLAPNTTFRGFEVRDDQEKVVGAGDQAAGWMHVGDGKVGLTIAMKDFFENFPKAFAFDGARAIDFDIWPEETAGFHWLDDGQQKTTEFLLVAHGKNSAAPSDFARAFNAPLRPFADPEWTRRSGAWADLGDLDDPDPSDEAMIAFDDDQFELLKIQAFTRTSYAFGWSEFGEQIWAKSTHTTGSPRNKLTYWDKFAMTGSYSAFRIPELFALHSRDLRTYHIDGFSKEARPNAVLWEALPVWSLSPDQLGRDALDPALDPHRAGVPANGHGWNAFDVEHMSVDDLYEYYLMTGDPVSLDSLREIGEVMRTWLIYSTEKAPGSSRGVGWSMRALIKIWQVTGEQRMLDSADELVASVAATYGQEPSPVTGIVYHYVTRYPPHANHLSNDEYDLPWQLACVIYGFLLHHDETGDPLSREIALNVADYMVDFGWNGVAMDEALAVDDHGTVNHKSDNSGINIWIPSALALAYRESRRPEYLYIANTMFNSIPGLTNPVSYNGYGTHHWWHGLRSLLLGY